MIVYLPYLESKVAKVFSALGGTRNVAELHFSVPFPTSQ